MRRARWILRPAPETARPVIYHCISRVVDRRFVFQADEKEKLRTFMRMYESFTGCRILSYCLMCNHLHLLLEVTPMPVGGLSDEALLERLKALYNEAFVADVARELTEARKQVATGLGEAAVLVGRIHERFTYRMHDLSEFMKGFMQRYTQWHNRTHERCGHLWEDRFKSVIVEDGVAAKTIAAYIDLNPVRAGMVTAPEDYRWSSYGEAIGGGARGEGGKARAGLVRALRCHKGAAVDVALWKGDVALEYRRVLLAGVGEKTEQMVSRSGAAEKTGKRKSMNADEIPTKQHVLREAGEKKMGEIPFGRMLRCRVRYFSDGVVIGSRQFVDQMFESARDRFGPRRRNGARAMRGDASAAAGMLWSLRDLRKK
ncbi:MAG: transposase [Luteolibacter sp.]|jgi:REP element-mobilizing transposase RayT|nr:transposase [Luteolibacter sp.]